MTIRDWQQLSPSAAAQEVHHRVRTRLIPQQQRAVVAQLGSTEMLTEAFAAADRSTPIGGVPYFLKDLFDVADLPTLAGSTFLPELRPTPLTSSRIYHRLKDAGAVFAGKTHLHEFAYGVTGENSHWGDCEHPRFPGRTTGGSSSGSAAAVAAGIVPFAIGTDTGGSVRVPAAFCGLYGFRLTPGDELIRDAFPLAPSFDTAGWFTATAADMSSVLSALVNPMASVATPRGCYLPFPGLDDDVTSACRTAAAAFAGEPDASTRATLLHGFGRAAEIYNRVVAAEAWSVHAAWAERYRERYDPAVWPRLVRGVTQPRAVYDEAVRDLTEVRAVWKAFFTTYDFLVLPAVPFSALRKADCTLANRQRILELTAPASLGGRPVLTVPVALPSGLTCGLQVVVEHPRSPVLTSLFNGI